MVVSISNVVQGNGLVSTFCSKIKTRFVTYVYDPVGRVMVLTTLSDSANKRYITQHVFTVKLADVPLVDVSGTFTTASAFLVHVTFS